MRKTTKILLTAAGAIVGLSLAVGGAAFVKERVDEKKQEKQTSHHHMGFYERFLKRPFDAVLSTGAAIAFSPILGVTALLVRIKHGSPVLFTQDRPGKDEKIFKLYKFRTMTDKRDKNRELLSDEVRLTSFGKTLRSTSLDELPELFNIIKGDMAVVGPRPLLVRYLPRYNSFQRRRHEVRPGLTGIAQVEGRNALSWDEKFEYDVEYVDHITFLGDCKIILNTVGKVFKREGITEAGNATMEEFWGNDVEPSADNTQG